jgi:hypothetical protein
MSSHEGPGDRPRETWTRAERMERIFEQLSQEQPVQDASQAYEIVRSAFQNVESQYLIVHPNRRDTMRVSSFVGMPSMNYNGRTVLYDFYARDILFLGDNGSIEIRSTKPENVNATQESHPYSELPLRFAKRGADTRGVWE